MSDFRRHPALIVLPQNKPWNRGSQGFKERLQVNYQVFQLLEMGQRFDGDEVSIFSSFADQGLTGQRGLSIDAHRARTTDGAAAGAAKRKGGVLLPDQEQSIQHRLASFHTHREFLEKR